MANPLGRDNPFSIIAAPVFWAVHFCVVYGTNAVACAKGIIGPGAVDAVIGVATLVTLALLAGLAMLAWARFTPVRDARDHVHESDPRLAILARRRFMALSALLLCGLSILATAYVALPALLVPKC